MATAGSASPGGAAPEASTALAVALPALALTRWPMAQELCAWHWGKTAQNPSKRNLKHHIWFQTDVGCRKDLRIPPF